MNLQKDDIHQIYFHYLFPCLFSGLATSIYSLVDMIVVGQYFTCDMGMGALVILFNDQIMRYFGNNELAIYGVAGNIFI